MFATPNITGDENPVLDLVLLSTNSHMTVPMAGTPTIADTVHLVSSVCLPDKRTVTKRLCNALPSPLRRIPDDETGKRCNFVVFQGDVFNESPFVKGPLPPSLPISYPDRMPRRSRSCQLSTTTTPFPGIASSATSAPRVSSPRLYASRSRSRRHSTL
ncbi:hypothetical protein HO173_005726 [Letharia columbiana]|uniref:Uncharacterized protein n=1 Tax=Letharia columbiana TaxID=112416 RepID=A0A8H6FWH6_9LECA|nr:uncharacterized protein HO173_005726 [Letharia columbiana]KAF6236098.1 hypothetical protein HO173_005726 [Letharia columbiana]